MQIEQKLGMLRAYVDHTIYLSQWIRQHVFCPSATRPITGV